MSDSGNVREVLKALAAVVAVVALILVVRSCVPQGGTPEDCGPGT